MNSIITLNRLSELIARASGTKMSVTETYLKAFMETAKEAIANDEALTIKGIGTFTIEDLRGERKILFQPDEELAKAVNDPFAMFEPEELAPGADIETLDIDIIIDDIIPEPKPEPKGDLPEETPHQEAATVIDEQPSAPEICEEAEGRTAETEFSEKAETPELAKAPVLPDMNEDVDSYEASENTEKGVRAENAQKEDKGDEEELEEASAPPIPIAPKTSLAAAYRSSAPKAFADELDEEESEGCYEGDYEEEKGKFPVFWTAWALIIGLLIGLAIGFFAHDPICELLEPTTVGQEEESAEEAAESTYDEPLAAEDATAETTDATEEQTAPEEEAAKPDVYDTITEHTFLANLAQKHYRKKDYWVYIYLENKDIIGNPNTIKAGTRVKIPPLEKYAKHPTEEENLREAKALATKILNQ